MGYQQRGGRTGTRDRASAPAQLPSAKIAQAISEGGRPLVEVAEELGRRLKDEDLSTSQIRNIYGVVKKMQLSGEFDPKQFVLLKPKLAYAARRRNERGVQTLRDALSPGIDLVGDDPAKFGHFVDLFEAILAYHQALGGKK